MKKKEILIHTIIWIVYLANTVISYDQTMLARYGYTSIAIKQFVYYTSIIIVFYINFLFLIPAYLGKRRFTAYGIAVVLMLPLRVGLQYVDAYILDWYFDAGTFFIDDLNEGWPYTLFTTAFFLVISTGARFSRDWFVNRKRIEELEREQSRAELALLHYQINPHFLFNTLNNIYSLVTRNAAHAADAVLMFSNIMRYSMSESFETKVDLRQEIEYLKSFVELHKLRINNPEIVGFDITGEPETLIIAPMLLIPFVENAFKHGSVSGNGKGINIRLEIIQSTVHFTVRNEIKPQEKDSTGGIGLANVKRRLELLYPERHSLNIQQTNDLYTVELTIDAS